MNISENSAESKYKFIKPWLLFSVGDGTINEAIVSRKKSALSSKTNEKNSTSAISFNSIPVVCVLPKTHHVVASEFATPKYPVGRLQILDRKGILVNGFSTEIDRRHFNSFGIANSTEDDQIAVCIGGGVAIWNVEGKLLLNMKSREVENCCHITKMRDGVLATTCISDQRGRCVTLWDPKCGKVVSQFGSRPERVEINPLKGTQKFIIRNNDIRMPWFLTSNSRNEVLIADRNAKCIKVFDTRNKRYLRKFDTHGIDARSRKSLLPQGLCADENDNVLVVDSFTHSLLLFDRHGVFVKVLARMSDQLQGEPWAVSVTTDQQVVAPINRARNQGLDDARTMVISVATPKPMMNIYKLSFCPHYTHYI